MSASEEAKRGKAWRDHDRWQRDAPMPVPVGWTRYPIEPGQDEFDVMPEEYGEDVDRPFLVEWRPSSIMGWGKAAVWVGPVEEDYRADRTATK